MTKTKQMQIRLEPELKTKAEAMLAPLGLKPTEFIRMALRQLVTRNGSLNNNPETLRSANRNRNDTGNRNNNGFRIALTLDRRSRRSYGTVRAGA